MFVKYCLGTMSHGQYYKFPWRNLTLLGGMRSKYRISVLLVRWDSIKFRVLLPLATVLMYTLEEGGAQDRIFPT